MAVQRYSYTKGKRRRQDSFDHEIQIEELSPDDMAYDGDTEVLRPDQYEDIDSDFEDDRALRRLWPDTDDELAGRLRRLSCDARKDNPKDPSDEARGQKRQSAEMDLENEPSPHKRTEIEVLEVVDGQPEQRPIKRRRKRATKSNIAHRLVRKPAPEDWTDSSEKTDDQEVMESSNATSPAPATPAPTTPARAERNEDAMDIS
ncbi:hypothetical protein PV08_10699 [Exophiala spinifera]|uniref:Uncharacterized protein n=1 Tax=Exophiala spinifera TaxID=91928 RepID=A0A0D2BJ78_9EURO|nr:uncharacterized protein PV08_10699 [Exophiala spinifera]KIW11399.1 hypothetical protein PV08_10699 [Exophiala spinifera]